MSYFSALFARSASDRLFLLISSRLLSRFFNYCFFYCSFIFCYYYIRFIFSPVSFFSSSYCLFLLNFLSYLSFLFFSSSLSINYLCSYSVRLWCSANYGFITSTCCCFSSNLPVANSSTYLLTGAWIKDWRLEA